VGNVHACRVRLVVLCFAVYQGEESMNNHLVVITYFKGEERYQFVYRQRMKVEFIRLLGRFAADSQLSFNWRDAAIVSLNIGEIERFECHRFAVKTMV
jgi:hypothetical protein